MSCLALRIGTAAIVGYSLGALTSGSATIAWLLAAAAAAGMYVWWRLASSRTGQACGSGCAVPRRRWRRQAGQVEAPVDVEAPQDTGHAVAGRRADGGGTDGGGTDGSDERELTGGRLAN